MEKLRLLTYFVRLSSVMVAANYSVLLGYLFYNPYYPNSLLYARSYNTGYKLELDEIIYMLFEVRQSKMKNDINYVNDGKEPTGITQIIANNRFAFYVVFLVIEVSVLSAIVYVVEKYN